MWQQYIKHVSVSQLKTHQRNPLRWALEKLEGWKTVGSPATEWGSKLHEAIELDGQGLPVPTDLEAKQYDCLTLWRNVNNEDKNLSAPRQQEFFEMDFIESLHPGLPPMRGVIDHIIVYDDCVEVIDHKTSKHGRFFLNADDMRQDWQMMLYAWVAFKLFDVDNVVIRQNQFKYGLVKPKLQVVATEVTRQEVDNVVAQIAQEIRDGILKTIATYDAHGISAVPHKCATCPNAFGPNSCEFYPRCCSAGLTTTCACDTVNEKVGDMDVLRLPAVMRLAKANVGNIPNKWDHRDAVVEAAIEVLKADDVENKLVILPSYLTAAQLDSLLYRPVIDWLTEQDIKVYVEFN